MKPVAVSGGGNVITMTAMSDAGDASLTMRMSTQQAEKGVLDLLFTLASLNPVRWQETYDNVREIVR